MKFRYIGDSSNMTAYGHDFRDGSTPDVTDPDAVHRLNGNRFFECVEPLMAVTQEGETVEVPVIRKKPGRKPKAKP